MAIITFRGDAAAVAQVSTVQITAYDAATTYRITINGKVVGVVGTGGGVNTTAAALQAALAASTFPEFQEITFTVNTATITMTSNTAGQSFTATSSVSGGTGTIGSVTAVTANSGPGDLSQASNYSGGALPSNGDTLIFENVSGVNITEGLTALQSIALAQVIFRNWGGKIGLPQHNGKYWEYRQTYLKLSATEVQFDCPNCQLARIDSQAAQTLLKVFNTGSSEVQNLETLVWKGTHASNVVQLDGGSIGIAVLAGETATIATLNQGYITQQESDSRVRCGAGVTLTTINRIGGTLELNTGATTINSKDGAGLLTLRGTGNYTTLTLYAGGVEYLGSGTITNMTLGEEITFDGRRNEAGYSITNAVQAFKGAKFLDPAKRATWAGIVANGCRPHELFVDRGPGCTITAS